MNKLPEKKRDFERRYAYYDKFPYPFKEVFLENDVEQIRTSIWNWFSLVLQDGLVSNEETKREIETIHGLLGQLLDSAYEVLYERDLHDIYHVDYRQYVKSSIFPIFSNGLDLYREKIRLHEGRVIYLTLEECLDCYLPLENFFYYAGIAEWKRKLAHWKEAALNGHGAVEDMDDDRIAPIYEHLVKLVEACYVYYAWVFEFKINSPLIGYSERAWVPIYCEFDGFDNPFKYLNKLLRSENASSLKMKMSKWHKRALYKEQQWPGVRAVELIRTHSFFQSLFEVAYLISRCAYWPKEWFEREQWQEAYDPLTEGDGYNLIEHHLEKEELANPFQVFVRVFAHRELGCHRSALQECLENALDPKTAFDDSGNYLQQWVRLIEALYLINVQVYFGLLKDQSGEPKD